MAHSLNDDITYLLADNLGIGVWCARHLMIAKVKDMAPFGKRVGVCHYGIGIKRKNTSCILRFQARLQQYIISPLTHPAYKAIHHTLPSGATIIPMRTRYLHTALLL